MDSSAFLSPLLGPPPYDPDLSSLRQCPSLVPVTVRVPDGLRRYIDQNRGHRCLGNFPLAIRSGGSPFFLSGADSVLGRLPPSAKFTRRQYPQSLWCLSPFFPCQRVGETCFLLFFLSSRYSTLFSPAFLSVSPPLYLIPSPGSDNKRRMERNCPFWRPCSDYAPFFHLFFYRLGRVAGPRGLFLLSTPQPHREPLPDVFRFLTSVPQRPCPVRLLGVVGDHTLWPPFFSFGDDKWFSSIFFSLWSYTRRGFPLLFF